MTLELTEQEANTLIALLDAAVRAKGLEAAQAALYFHNKLKEAFKVKNEASAV